MNRYPLSHGSADSPQIRVIVVDDQAVVRAGFVSILSTFEGITLAGEAGDGETAVLQARVLRPDVILMDVQMPGMDGITATEIITENTASKVIILTTFEDDDYLFRGLSAGASGYLLKTCEPEELVSAIRGVVKGHGHLSGAVTRRVIERVDTTNPMDKHDPRLDQLTRRELDVLTEVARGLTNAEVAMTLGVSVTTVKTHLSNCFAKLQLRDRVQLVIFAYESGLILSGE